MKRILIPVLICILLTVCAVSAQDIMIGRPTETSMPPVSGEGIISGQGNNTVTLRDRNYEKSVDFENAQEVFENGMDVPKPDLDRPITEAYDDLKPGYSCQAILNSPYYFQELHFGEEFTLDVTFINNGTEAWTQNIDVMQYTGDRLEKKYVGIYDIDKDYKDSIVVYPGHAIRFTLPMRAPTEKYHDDNKYYSAYTLVKNWNRYGLSELRSDSWNNDHMVNGEYVEHYNQGDDGMFCPIYFYIYVKE